MTSKRFWIRNLLVAFSSHFQGITPSNNLWDEGLHISEGTVRYLKRSEYLYLCKKKKKNHLHIYDLIRFPYALFGCPDLGLWIWIWGAQIQIFCLVYLKRDGFGFSPNLNTIWDVQIHWFEILLEMMEFGKNPPTACFFSQHFSSF